jgi:hypothetical protein
MVGAIVPSYLGTLVSIGRLFVAAARYAYCRSQPPIFHGNSSILGRIRAELFPKPHWTRLPRCAWDRRSMTFHYGTLEFSTPDHRNTLPARHCTPHKPMSPAPSSMMAIPCLNSSSARPFCSSRMQKVSWAVTMPRHVAPDVIVTTTGVFSIVKRRSIARCRRAGRVSAAALPISQNSLRLSLLVFYLQPAIRRDGVSVISTPPLE